MDRIAEHPRKLLDQVTHPVEIHLPAIEEEEPLRILDIQGPAGYQLVNEQIFGPRHPDRYAGELGRQAGLDRLLLKREPCQTGIDGDSGRLVKGQQNLTSLSELQGALNSRTDLVVGEHTENLLRMAAPTLDGDVDVGGVPGDSEGDHRHSTNDHRG